MTDRMLRTDRLNGEPPIFRGCTSSELVMLAALAAAFWVPMGVLIGALVGTAMMGVGFSGIAIIATVVVAGSLFQRIKRGRPDHFYQHRLILWAEELGLRRSGFIRRGGTWDLGRRRWP
ncbi:TIGR03750 family conjugal transfer protein [Ectothiorhodospira haloalkaliphila]|uniref:TIGR03750 family conjugal transfer protein n=1 Tax=Ectothiorhodospira haloalkaliphila TaxID=421628 RepID=UPI001EE83E65|nr:TIGR03750 family conjugal transfer protein [Ectothiorhodospira haloalkaliphila]MCG5526570.1 TIGR03750 family conjugal transfer protein [Ectothiorhodospira haloalkaliphila]